MIHGFCGHGLWAPITGSGLQSRAFGCRRAGMQHVTCHCLWMNHVIYINESCHTYKCDMVHVWVSHVTLRMWHATHMKESCHRYEWVMSQIWNCYVTHMSTTRHTHESFPWERHATHIYRVAKTYRMPYLYRSFTEEKNPLKLVAPLRKMTCNLRHPMGLRHPVWMSPMKETCQTYECVMWHKWMCDVTHMNESCHTYECVTWHILGSHVTHMKAWRGTYEWVLPHIWTRDVAHMEESCHIYECVMSHIWMHHVT